MLVDVGTLSRMAALTECQALLLLAVPRFVIRLVSKLMCKAAENSHNSASLRLSCTTPIRMYARAHMHIQYCACVCLRRVLLIPFSAHDEGAD